MTLTRNPRLLLAHLAALAIGATIGTVIGRHDGDRSGPTLQKPAMLPSGNPLGGELAVPATAAESRQFIDRVVASPARATPIDALRSRIAYAHWLKADADEAMAFLRQLLESNQNPELARQCLVVLARERPDDCLELIARADPASRVVHGYETAVHETLARTGGLAAVEKLMRTSEPGRQALNTSLLIGLASSEPAAVHEKLAASGIIDDRQSSSILHFAVLSSVALHGVRDTLERIKDGDFGESRWLMSLPMESWFDSDAPGLFRWISDLSDPSIQNEAVLSAVGIFQSRVDENNYPALRDWISEQVPPDLRDRAHREVLSGLARKSVPAATSYLQDIERASGPNESLRSLLEFIASQANDGK